MDFHFSKSEEGFRRELVEFLTERNAQRLAGVRQGSRGPRLGICPSDASEASRKGVDNYALAPRVRRPGNFSAAEPHPQ